MTELRLPYVDGDRWESLRASLVDDESPETDRRVPPVLQDVVARYGTTSAQRLAGIRTALAEGDEERAAADLHLLRGSSAMLGAARVERLAALLETDLIAHGLPANWAELCEELARACEETGDALRHAAQLR